MSLTGNLEDLPLLDILQIVSFSKKSGHLSIRSGDGEGGIVFLAGLVVSAFTWNDTPLDPRFGSLAEEARRRVIRTRIEIALEQLIRLREGRFSFSLTAKPPTALGPRDISEETLPVGINPQELLLDLARGIDEGRRDSAAAVEASFAQPDEVGGGFAAVSEGGVESGATHEAELPDAGGALEKDETVPIPLRFVPKASAAEAAAEAEPAAAAPAPTPGPATPEASRTILLVDDEEDVRRMLGDFFTGAGYQVVEAEDPESAVKKGGRLGKEGIPFLLVADLGMPTSGGSSFQGGFEVVKRLWKMHVRPPVLLMTERLSASIHLRARQMGIRDLVFKPGLSKLNPEQFEADMRAFAGKLLRDVLPRLGRAEAREKPKAAPKAPAAREEPSAPTLEELTHQLSMLQQRLIELRQPSDANQIAVLLMKVAREFFERGILFLIKNEEVRGLAAFGPVPKNQNINLLVREVVIPLSEPSPFLDVVESGKAYHGPLSEGKWSRHLMGKVGRFQSNGVALFPVVTHREPIAVLFGDNPETGRELGRLGALEVFVNQAGVALENMFLHKRIQSLQAKAE